MSLQKPRASGHRSECAAVLWVDIIKTYFAVLLETYIYIYIYMFIYLFIHVFIYVFVIYIYIERERDRDFSPRVWGRGPKGPRRDEERRRGLFAEEMRRDEEG